MERGSNNNNNNGTIPLEVDFMERIFDVCVERGKSYMHSKGLLRRDDPLDYVLPLTLFQIFLSVLMSRLVYFVLRPIRTPKFVCSLLGGILLGPSGLTHIQTFRTLMYPSRQYEILFVTASIAISYFIFILSMKMDTRMNLKSIKRTWRFGLFPFLTSFWVMSALTCLFYHGPGIPGLADEEMKRVRMAVLVTTSMASFPVVSEGLLELNLIASELGQIALSASMLNEIMQLMIQAVVTVLHNKNSEYRMAFMFCYTSFVLFCFYVIRPAAIRIARGTPPGKQVSEGFVVMIQLGVLVTAFLCDALGMSFVQGPLVMGLVMPSGPPLATTLEERTEAIIANLLLPAFFFFLGGRIDLLAIKTWGIIFKVQLILMAGFVAKIVACVVISLRYKMKFKHGIVLGLMLNMKGMVDLIIFSRMRTLEMMDDQIYAHMILSVMGVATIVSPLIELLYNPQSRVDKLSEISMNMMKTIQTTPRNSELRIISCVHKEGEVHSIIALLESLNPINSSMCVYVLHLIQLLGKSTPILRHINISKNKSWLLMNYPDTHHIMRAFHNFAHNSNQNQGYSSFVSVVPCINVAPYKTMHDSICNLAQDKCVPLIVLPFHQNDHTHDHCTAAAIRSLNASIQEYAPCTVGILVDKYSRLSISSNINTTSSSLSFFSSLFPVGVFFMGGADDREALALAMRMSEHKNIKIVLLRLVMRGKKTSKDDESGELVLDEEEREERRLDESLIDEFKALEFGNPQVAMEDVEVEGWEKVFDGIRKWEWKYDLVMVGRKHKKGCFNDEEMSSFEENVEMLGMVGDMLASSEFCNGIVPVLVVQCGGKRLRGQSGREASVEM